ncbi:MAG: hypothetical protein LBI39_03130 [Puniceicoccales bacterium]|jgi:hypothetical protein|nr:hypothetical protein [Puniceicoccales bacterium]
MNQILPSLHLTNQLIGLYGKDNPPNPAAHYSVSICGGETFTHYNSFTLIPFDAPFAMPFDTLLGGNLVSITILSQAAWDHTYAALALGFHLIRFRSDNGGPPIKIKLLCVSPHLENQLD